VRVGSLHDFLELVHQVVLVLVDLKDQFIVDLKEKARALARQVGLAADHGNLDDIGAATLDAVVRCPVGEAVKLASLGVTAKREVTHPPSPVKNPPPGVCPLHDPLGEAANPWQSLEVFRLKLLSFPQRDLDRVG